MHRRLGREEVEVVKIGDARETGHGDVNRAIAVARGLLLQCDPVLFGNV